MRGSNLCEGVLCRGVLQVNKLIRVLVEEASEVVKIGRVKERGRYNRL